LLGALAGLSLLGTAFVLWPRPPTFTQQRWNNSNAWLGTSREEVEAQLGPPGDYRTGPTRPTVTDAGVACSPGQTPLYVLKWEADFGCEEYGFDASGRVVSISFTRTERIAQPPLDNLLWRLWRQWRRWFP
jgi:hypothetical protein